MCKYDIYSNSIESWIRNKFKLYVMVTGVLIFVSSMNYLIRDIAEYDYSFQIVVPV